MLELAVGGVGDSRIAVPSFRQLDAAAGEERVHALEPRPPVDVAPVVGAAVEPDEMPTRRLAQAQQKIVEDLGPGPGVQHAAVGEHAVEVVEAGGGAVGQAEHLRRHGHGGEPRQRLHAGQPAEAGEDLRRLEPLLHELVSPRVEVRDVHGAVRGGQRMLGGVERLLPA